MDPRRSLVVVVAAMAVTMMMAATGVGGYFAADRAECSDKLTGLATCLTYVQEQATAAAPTRDCCSGLKTVLQTSRKCLCVLVKDRDDPSLGLKINVTKALGLPDVCRAAANISNCPRLLNLPPNSKDAQVFEQYAKQTAAQGSPAATDGAAVKAAAAKSGAAAAVGPVTLRWVGVGGARAAVVISVFFSALAVPFLLLLG